MRVTDKIVQLESRVAKLESENKSLKLRIEEMVTVEQLDAKRKMNSICERRELSLLNAKHKNERQNGVQSTCARRLSFSEVIGCSGGYDEIDG